MLEQSSARKSTVGIYERYVRQSCDDQLTSVNDCVFCVSGLH